MTPAVLLLAVVVAYRVVLGMAGSSSFEWLHNFAPVAAIALCGAVYLPRRAAILLPLGMLFLSDLALNLFHYHEPMLTWQILPRYLALALIGGIGFFLRARQMTKLTPLLVGGVASSVVFYLVTNSASWIADPGYAKTGADWFRAMTTGLPGLPPTWWFYKHTLISDVLFTLLFAFSMAPRRSSVPATAPAAQAAS